MRKSRKEKSMTLRMFNDYASDAIDIMNDPTLNKDFKIILFKAMLYRIKDWEGE
jgi:hypothetical protein